MRKNRQTGYSTTSVVYYEAVYVISERPWMLFEYLAFYMHTRYFTAFSQAGRLCLRCPATGICLSNTTGGEGLNSAVQLREQITEQAGQSLYTR